MKLVLVLLLFVAVSKIGSEPTHEQVDQAFRRGSLEWIQWAETNQRPDLVTACRVGLALENRRSEFLLQLVRKLKIRFDYRTEVDKTVLRSALKWVLEQGDCKTLRVFFSGGQQWKTGQELGGGRTLAPADGVLEVLKKGNTEMISLLVEKLGEDVFACVDQETVKELIRENHWECLRLLVHNGKGDKVSGAIESLLRRPSRSKPGVISRAIFEFALASLTITAKGVFMISKWVDIPDIWPAWKEVRLEGSSGQNDMMSPFDKFAYRYLRIDKDWEELRSIYRICLTSIIQSGIKRLEKDPERVELLRVAKERKIPIPYPLMIDRAGLDKVYFLIVGGREIPEYCRKCKVWPSRMALFECGHIFCQSCADYWILEPSPKCPFCVPTK